MTGFIVTICAFEISWGMSIQCSDLFLISNMSDVKRQILDLNQNSYHFKNASKVQRAREYINEIQSFVLIKDFKFLLDLKLRSIAEMNQLLLEGIFPISYGVDLNFIDGRNIEGPLDLPVHDLGHTLAILLKVNEKNKDKNIEIDEALYKNHLARLKLIYKSAKKDIIPTANSDWAFEVVWFELFHESYLLHLTKENFEIQSEKINRNYGDYYEHMQDRLTEGDFSFSSTNAANRRDLKVEILHAFETIRKHFN